MTPPLSENRLSESVNEADTLIWRAVAMGQLTVEQAFEELYWIEVEAKLEVDNE